MVSNPETLTLHQRILEAARQRFFQEGYARVTMDALARELGISKKTLYQHFPNKAALAAAIMEKFRQEVYEALESIFHHPSLPLPERLARAFGEAAHRLRQLERPFLEDLSRFLPAVWAETERFRAEAITRFLGRALAEGQASGMVRTDVPAELMLRSFLATAERLVTPAVLMQLPYTLPELIHMLIRLFFEGVLTDEARLEFRGVINRLSAKDANH